MNATYSSARENAEDQEYEKSAQPLERALMPRRALAPETECH